MAKAKKSKKIQKPVKSTKSSLSLKSWHSIPFAILFIIIITLLVSYDLAFKGLTPAGGDVISSEGKVHLIEEFEEETGEEALWNPAIFAGMPIYHRYGPRAWSIDTFFNYFYEGKSGQVIVYYIIGAVGMFVLLYSLNFSVLISIFGAICFLLIPHYNSLWLAGHFSKFRAIMFIPWVFASFNYLINKKTILAALMFTLAISLQVRTQHYQIIFYTWTLLFMVGVYPVVKMLLEKDFKSVFKFLGLILAAVLLTILTVYQPLFVMHEYTPYSTRGGNPVNIASTDNSAEKAKGVSFEYATQWSLSPKEMICFLIPRYFGGTSHENYQGNDVPQLKGRTIPGYWGDMPFTGSSDYIGVAVFVLMILGIVGNWKNTFVRSLTVFTIFAILLAFGRHLSFFYKLFFYNLPYFSKFRVPTMIMMAVFFVFIVLAMYGIKYLIDSYNRQDKRVFTVLYIIAGFLVALSLSPFILKGVLPFATKMEPGQYNPQILSMLKQARFELMKMDALRTLLFSVLTMAVIFTFLKKYIKPNTMILLLLFISAIDVYLINTRFTKDLVTEDRIESQYFARSELDNYLLSRAREGDEQFRVLGLGSLFGNNMLSYYHQCIGGYDAAKLQLIQDVIDNNMFQHGNYRQPANWKIIDMLNGKFIITESPVQGRDLKLILTDEKRNLSLYENEYALPRAFFVGHYQHISDPRELLREMNRQNFDPRQVALLEEKLPMDITAPDSSSFVQMIDYTPDKITLKTSTNTHALLVISEIYYPVGWKAFIDGEETKIYKTNHLLRSILLPEGEHEVVFSFQPMTYINGKRIATVFNLLLIFSIIGLVITKNKNYFKF